jgi:glycosyltransferase involved in cell wall biosynthesis
METWSHRMAEELARLGPVEVVALPGRSDGRPPSVARLLEFPFTALRRFAAMAAKPGIVHLGDLALWPLGILAWLAPGSTLAISAHGTDVSYHRRGGLKGGLYGAYLRMGARLFPRARVIANSRATADAAEETGWRVAAIVPLATDLTAPAAHGHDGSVLFAGRLVARKGFGWFAREVLPLLPATIRVKVAGTAWDAGENAALDNPRVDFLGPLHAGALARAYASALCVVVPNIELANGEFEGFGLVACEAAACGGVVLAASTGGLIEAVRDGHTGLLLPPGDAPEWSAAIERVMGWSEAERAQFTDRARTAARTHYAWPRVARETVAAYGSVA